MYLPAAGVHVHDMHCMSPGQNESGFTDQATFKSLLSLWSPEIILVCSYSHPCQDVFGPVCGHILHSCIQNRLQDAQSTSLYSKASHAFCDCANPNNDTMPCGCDKMQLQSFLSMVPGNNTTAGFDLFAYGKTGGRVQSMTLQQVSGVGGT